MQTLDAACAASYVPYARPSLFPLRFLPNMRRRLFLFAVFLLGALLSAAGAAAQGFSTFSGRNHPELRWQVAETEHFEIMYPQRLAGIEVEAAPLAEATYDALSRNLGVAFDDKIRIYLSDEDEIANGFASPIAGGYTDIWVHTNSAAAVFTGREKWLRKVLAHELTHLFHFRAVAARPFWLGYLFGNPTPRFWTEGLAQYETEAWDAQRGDRWLRAAVLGDQLSYEDGRSIWNGRLLYAVGSAQVRYLAAQKGDSTLKQILGHRDAQLFGLLETHDFEAAFEAVTGEAYRAFYDDWRRHVNVYYNTLAGQLEPVDSLHAEPMGAPGRYLYDVQFNPADTAQAAVLSLASPRRPVTRLYVAGRAEEKTRAVAEGAIQAPVAWRPDGQQLAFARTARGAYGSLLNDLFLVNADGSGLRRLTRSRRASSPTFSPDGRTLAFVGSEGGTANLFTLALDTGQETKLTDFTGDVQILSARWSPDGRRIAFALFAADGVRSIAALDLETNQVMPLTDGRHDDRRPVWRPDGAQLAYTSLRDGIPNVFIYDLAAQTHRRVTRLALGATATDWRPPDSARAAGAMAVTVTVSKERDRAFLIDAARTASAVTAEVPAPYTGWTTHRPPREVPPALPEDAALIASRRPYRAWKNVRPVASLALPYYLGPGDAGLAGFTAWTEPLGKHTFAAAAALSVTDLAGGSFFSGSYVNRQRRPTLTLSGYRFPGSARAYGEEVLVEDYAGGDLTASWPLDLFSRPYTATRLSARLRYVGIRPLNPDAFDAPSPDALAAPEQGQQADLRLALTRRRLRPYRDNYVHPLDGRGIKLQLTGAAPILGADASFARGDLAAFAVLPSVGLQRLYLYGRAQAQTGAPLPQDYLGLSRYDHAQIALPGLLPLTLGDAERVRGFRTYAVGNRLLFGTAEYRVPLAPSLRTELLGALSLGATALAAFVDGGAVWNGGAAVARRVGVGLEVKNALTLFGFRFTHALGLAQPAPDFGRTDEHDLYYRIQAAAPF